MNKFQKIPPADEVHLLHAKLCRAVGDPKRIQLFYALADGQHSVGQLAEILDTPQPTISRHLAVLRESGTVTTSREGTTVVYSLAVPEIIEVIDAMRSILRTVIARQSNTLEEEPAVE